MGFWWLALGLVMLYKTYSIPCGPYKWQVRFCDRLDADNYGETLYETQEVKLWKDRNKARLLETKLHEYTHVIDNVFALGLSEAQVHTLAVGLAQIMRGRVDPGKV